MTDLEWLKENLWRMHAPTWEARIKTLMDELDWWHEHWPLVAEAFAAGHPELAKERQFIPPAGSDGPQ
jgi:hypothetical protein